MTKRSRTGGESDEKEGTVGDWVVGTRSKRDRRHDPFLSQRAPRHVCTYVQLHNDAHEVDVARGRVARRDSTERKGTLEGRKEDVDEEEKETASRCVPRYAARRKERRGLGKCVERASATTGSRARRRKRVGTGANRGREDEEGGAGGE